MNREAFESSPVHQMMGGSPIWWNLNRPTQAQQTSPLLPSYSSSTPSSSSSSSSSSASVFPQYPHPSNLQSMTSWQHHPDQLPESWSQLLLGGLVEEEGRCSLIPFQTKKMEDWDQDHHQVLYSSSSAHMVDVKQEILEKGYQVYSQGNEEIQALRSSWSQILPNSSPRSCVTTSFSSSMLDFSNNKSERRHHPQDQSSHECNSTQTGSPYKKARVQTSSATCKVRKEKLGDRITALHQLVSPFGKTDTASVLLEAIGYIRFLQSQIEALSTPYLTTGSGNIKQPAQGERSCIFPEDPGQLLNDNCLKRRGSDQDGVDEPKKDLRSRGLCLVPVSFTLHVGSDNSADYWAPTFGGGFR